MVWGSLYFEHVGFLLSIPKKYTVPKVLSMQSRRWNRGHSLNKFNKRDLYSTFSSGIREWTAANCDREECMWHTLGLKLKWIVCGVKPATRLYAVCSRPHVNWISNETSFSSDRIFACPLLAARIDFVRFVVSYFPIASR